MLKLLNLYGKLLRNGNAIFMLQMDGKFTLILFPMEIRSHRKTYMTRVEGENTRLRHYLARLKRKTLCYSKSEQMLRHSIRLLIHYLRFGDVPVPAQNQKNHFCCRRSPLSFIIP